MWQKLFISIVVFNAVTADIYFHSPRGSNNRLNENSAQRRNANRAFDSQNNNRGGYNVGDKTDKASRSEEEQYRMTYFQSGANVNAADNGKNGESKLYLEWTNQHGCGGDEETDPHKLNCNIVIQFMCMPEKTEEEILKLSEDQKKHYNEDKLRNGKETNTQSYQKGNPERERRDQAKNRKFGSVRTERVLQESWESYDRCVNRNRNEYLFTADQRLKGDGAIYTRQNPNGNRRGYECPEERDYYPYWHPTDWKDIAYLADKQEHCNLYVKDSFNVVPKGECLTKFSDGKYRHWSKYNMKTECETEGGEWVEFTNYLEIMEGLDQTTCLAKNSENPGIQYAWALPLRPTELKMINVGIDRLDKKCLVLLNAPECIEAPRTRVNHLGNTATGNPIRYTWTLPHFPSGKKQSCLLRIRYNISTDDYDPYNTDYKSNYNSKTGQQSPIQQNPAVDIGAENQALRLAINTAQFGRTFQDRTHLFNLVAREAPFETETIHNIGVRGKRGNIVQVYPAVEYDFIPNDLSIPEGDLVQFQWTGSNTHNNGNPGGDGQTGDAGEGRRGTDRHNIVQINSRDINYPTPYEHTTMFKNAQVKWSQKEHKPMSPSVEDITISHASSGYYYCQTEASCDIYSVDKKNEMNNLLDNAPPSYRGMLLKFAKGVYHYMCTRNNNFTNRSQKGTLTVGSTDTK